MSNRLAVENVKEALVQGKVPLPEIGLLRRLLDTGFMARLALLEKRGLLPPYHAGSMEELDRGRIEE